jgi:hypothetical protein
MEALPAAIALDILRLEALDLTSPKVGESDGAAL